MSDKHTKHQILPQIFKLLSPLYLVRHPALLGVEIILIVGLITLFKVISQAEQQANDWLIIGVLSALLLFSCYFRVKAEVSCLQAAKLLIPNGGRHNAKKILSPNITAATIITSAFDLNVGDLILLETGDTVPVAVKIIQGEAKVEEGISNREKVVAKKNTATGENFINQRAKILEGTIVAEVTQQITDVNPLKLTQNVIGNDSELTKRESISRFKIFALSIISLLLVSVIYYIGRNSGVGIGSLRLSPIVFLAFAALMLPICSGTMYWLYRPLILLAFLRNRIILRTATAVEKASQVNAVLIDKTGNVTSGNRTIEEFYPSLGVSNQELSLAAAYCSIGDETTEGRSIIKMAKERFSADPDISKIKTYHHFSLETRMSGVDLDDGTQIRKGAMDALLSYLSTDKSQDKFYAPIAMLGPVERIAKSGGTTLAVGKAGKLIGVLHLKDTIKQGITEKLAAVRKHGIRSVMITGDSVLAGEVIAREAGVDDFMAESNDQRKIDLIKSEQSYGRVVALCGKRATDEVVLSKADVPVTMTEASEAALKAAIVYFVDQDQSKLLDMALIGKKTLATLGKYKKIAVFFDCLRVALLSFILFPAFYLYGFERFVTSFTAKSHFYVVGVAGIVFIFMMVLISSLFSKINKLEPYES
ncbi:MAG: HAD-IC family P-type ATPase [Alphaproteobacteria bacterium]